METHPTVTLGTRGGEREVPVIAQPHAYLVRLLEDYLQRAGAIEALGALLEGAGPAEAFRLLVDAGDSLVYDLLEKILPDLPVVMGKHQFAGFRTIDAYERNEYDPAEDRSPSFAQIEQAFRVASRVNRLDVVGTLFGAVKGWIDPKDLAAVKAAVSGSIGQTLTEFVSSLPSSPGPSGDARPSVSGETLRTDAAGDTPAQPSERELTPVG